MIVCVMMKHVKPYIPQVSWDSVRALMSTPLRLTGELHSPLTVDDGGRELKKPGSQPSSQSQRSGFPSSFLSSEHDILTSVIELSCI